jgi:hypothetical protein
MILPGGLAIEIRPVNGNEISSKFPVQHIEVQPDMEVRPAIFI